MYLMPYLIVSLLDDALPAAGKAELVLHVAGALHKVGVLQFSRAICALEHLTVVTAARANAPQNSGKIVSFALKFYQMTAFSLILVRIKF